MVIKSFPAKDFKLLSGSGDTVSLNAGCINLLLGILVFAMSVSKSKNCETIQKMHAKDFNVVSISLDNDLDEWRKGCLKFS